MTMTPYNGDITQALKWLQSNAPNIQSLVNQKAAWYQQYNDSFWSDWEANVFDISTANQFGILLWCIILGVPSAIFGIYGGGVSWAYGVNRQNFIYSGFDPTIPAKNMTGGNFFGGGSTTIIDIEEARQALMLRYATLVSNGSIKFINKMLRFVMNNNQPWNFPGKVYFYVTDSTAPAQSLVPTAPVTTDLHMEYRIGANLNLSAQFINILNDPKYGILPSCAGTSYTVIQEP